jgi:hypothetical protein
MDHPPDGYESALVVMFLIFAGLAEAFFWERQGGDSQKLTKRLIL